MKIDKIWVVIKPTKHSTMRDILFHADMSRLRLQFLGGLTAREIVGVWTTRREAEKVAKSLLQHLRV